MKTAACPVCLGNRLDPYLHVPRLNFTQRIRKGDILKCLSCGAFSLHPFPTSHDIKELYQDLGVFSDVPANPFTNRLLFKQFEYLYREFADGTRFVAKTCLRIADAAAPRVLDVGCGRGILLGKFQRYRPTAVVTGIDLDPGAKANAPAGLHDNVLTGSVDDVPSDRRFDIITAQFVIEHVLEPVSFLNRIHALLADDGCVMLSTPDIGSCKARDRKEAWDLISRESVKIGHCLWYDHVSFKRLVEARGFRIVKLTNRGEAIDHLPKLIQRLLFAILGTDRASGRFICSYHLRILWSVLIDGYLSERLGLGENMYVFLKKSGVPAVD